MTNESVLISLLQNARTISVVFKGNSKQYTYKVPAGVELAVGDKVVVDSPIDGYVIVSVVKVHADCGIDIEAAFKYKWIVCKVDDTKYNELVSQERTMEEDLKKLRRKAAVRKQVKALLGELDEGDLPESLSGLKEWL